MSSAKTKHANGAGKKTKQSAPSSTGTSTPVTPTHTTPELSSAFEFVTYGSGRPDKALYDAEQNKIKSDIDAAQAKLVRIAQTHANYSISTTQWFVSDSCEG